MSPDSNEKRRILTATEFDFYHANGYLSLENIVSDEELEEIKQVYMKLVFPSNSTDFLDVPTTFKEDYGDHSSPEGTPQDQWKMINVTLPSIHAKKEWRDNPAVKAYNERVQDIAAQLFSKEYFATTYGVEACTSEDENQNSTNSNGLMVWEYDQILAKKPNKKDAIFPLHQDQGYWYNPNNPAEGVPLNSVKGFESTEPDVSQIQAIASERTLPSKDYPTETCTFSLAINDATAENGCLTVVPKSGLKKVERPHVDCLDNGAEENSISKSEKEEHHLLQIALQPDEKLIPISVKAGGCTIHDEWIVHGSGGNATENTWRHTYFAIFFCLDRFLVLVLQQYLKFVCSFNTFCIRCFCSWSFCFVFRGTSVVTQCQPVQYSQIIIPKFLSQQLRHRVPSSGYGRLRKIARF